MSQPTPQQLREELLIEFDFTAPANWGIPALSKKLAELQAARDAEQGADESTDESGNETHDQKANEDSAKQSEQGDSPAAANEPATSAADLGAGVSNDGAESINSDTGENLPASNGDLLQKASTDANSVLMLTLLNHEVPGSDPKQVRVRNEYFYTCEPELYAGVAEVVAEVAPDDSEA